MRTAGLALTLFAALLFAPTVIQRARLAIRRVRRAEEFAEQARLDVLDLMSALTLVRGQRDRYKALYREAAHRNGLLLGHIGDERELAGTPLNDAVVIDWLDENTGWSA